MNCPVCDNRSEPFTEIKGYSISRCQVCGHGFVWPQPTQEELASAYSTSESAASNNNAFALLDLYRKAPDAVRRHYRGLVGTCTEILRKTGKSNPKILDAGCSCGVFLAVLRDAGFKNVSGTEMNSEAAKAGRGALGIDIAESSIENYRTREKFDLIIASALLEHVADPAGVLSRMRELLEEDGMIFFIVPNFGGILRFVMRGKWLWYMPPFHLHHFTLKSMRGALKKTGFAIDSLGTYNTGTYVYILHYMLFGQSRTEGTPISDPSKFAMAHTVDSIVKLVLSPAIYVCRMLGLGAHIVGVARKRV